MSARPDPHAAVQAAFHAALWSPETPRGIGPASSAARRMAVYRNNVQTGLIRALAARFPTVERLVGEAFFAAMARVFAARHPPGGPVLLEWGCAFPDFLARFEPVASLRYLPDVARLEWMRGQAFHAADHLSIDPLALGQGDPAGLVLRLAPCVALFESAQPAVSIWILNQPGGSPAPVPPRAEWAMIARSAAFEVVVEPLEQADAALLNALLGGATLGQAAQSHDPTTILALLIRHGAITAIERTCP